MKVRYVMGVIKLIKIIFSTGSLGYQDGEFAPGTYDLARNISKMRWNIESWKGD